MHVKALRDQRGAGILGIRVSTIGPADEAEWARAEQRLCSPPDCFLLYAKFGTDGVEASAPWPHADEQEDGSTQLGRCSTLCLPYFNLADDADSTDLSLTLKIVTPEFFSKREFSLTSPCNDGHESSSSPEAFRDAVNGKRHAHKKLAAAALPSESTRPLAVAILDVQRGLRSTSHNSGVTMTPEGNSHAFEILKRDLPSLLCQEFPDAIAVSVEVTFSKATFDGVSPGERRVARTVPPAENLDVVPALFVVATTLFDCATAMKDAELRLYTRCGELGRVSKLSSAAGGDIAVHESFEWNASADLSVLFSTAGYQEGELLLSRQCGTLIVALVDKATSNNRSRRVSCPPKWKKRLAREMGRIPVGVLELSLEQLVSCGVAGRWCPLIALAGSNAPERHAGMTDHRKYAGLDAVGEVLVAFAWMQKGPATDILPRDPPRYGRGAKCRKRPREKPVEDKSIGSSERKVLKKQAAAGTHTSTDASVYDESFLEHEDNIDGGSSPQEALVYIHVWDALVPRDRQGSALYLTLRLTCGGGRAQRVSTNPARGRGGLVMNAKSAGGASIRSPTAEIHGARRLSRAGFMHVVWDEHLSLSVKGPVHEGAMVELLLHDASVDTDVTVAAREGEPFRTFAERNRSACEIGLRHLEESNCSSTAHHHGIPGPTVYRLRLHQPSGGIVDGNDPSTSQSNATFSARTDPGFDGAEVRMASLVLEGHETAKEHGEDVVKAFQQRKADVARTPAGADRRLRTVEGGGGGTSCVNSTRLRTQHTRRFRLRSRLLDLSAASGLFHQFADDEEGKTRGIAAKDIAQFSPEVALGDAETRSFSETEKSVPMRRQEPSCSGFTISKESRRLVVQQYFPQLLPQPGCKGVHVPPSQLTADDGRAVTTAQAFCETSHDLSFADFVSWLRSLSQPDLGAAGLLVTPRTALHLTGDIIKQDADLAQELAATLELARRPTATVVRGWCSISLRSTEDAVAQDRVRLGWGRAGRGGREEDGPAERAWRRHTKMLRHDVEVLGEVLAELEGRCGRDPTARMGGADTNGVLKNRSQDNRGAVIPMDEETGGKYGEPPSSTAVEVRHDRGIRNASPPPKNTDSFADVGGLAEQDESGRCSIVALHIGQEAARLGLAAEHLKEALRCAADTLNREASHNLDDQREEEWPCGDGNGGGTRTSLVAAGRNERERDSLRGSVCRRHHGILLQRIKQVKFFQVEISGFQRRAAAIARRLRDEAKTLAKGRLEDVPRYDSELSSYRSAGAPRSALALVKRIRRAQNAACRQAMLGPPYRTPGVGGASAEKPSAPCDPCRTSFPEATKDSPAKRGNHDTCIEWQLPQDNVHSPPPCREPPEGGPGYPEGVVMPASSATESFASQTLVFDYMLRKPSSLQKVKERLERVRVTFRERAVDLPGTLSGATAEQIVDMARGSGKRGNGKGLTKLAPAAALCCPIDRFALHVFRTTGAAKEGGRPLYVDVQELACMGGLGTHATETSLWAAAARAGIVDIDRWIVAAVLRQATEAIDPTNDWGAGRIPQARPYETPKQVTAAADMGGSPSVVEATHNRGVMLAEATSLWEELRSEAFQSILGGSSSQSAGQGTVSIAEFSLTSSLAVGSPREETTQANRVAIAGETVNDEVGHSDHEDGIKEPHRERYNALSLSPGYFDHALMRTLVLAGRPRLPAVGLAKIDTATAVTAGTESLHWVDDILLHNFVIAGFADGSRLKLSDVVDAVIVRRQRSALGASAGTPLGGAFTDKHTQSEVEPDKNRNRPKHSQQPTGRPRDDVHLKLPSCGEVRPVAPGNGEHLTEVLIGKGAQAVCQQNAVGDVSTEAGMHPSYLVGIPPELHQLFRAAGIAAAARKRRRHQEEEQEQGNAEIDELGTAEQAIIRVLDTDRSLESAPFSGGKTALHHAAARGDNFLVRLLLGRGCKADVKDFEGKRACDLTRDLECLRLLGALKRATEPSALSLRRAKPDEAVEASGGTKQRDTAAIALSSLRAMVSVNFAVSFRRLGTEEQAGPPPESVAISGGSIGTTSRPGAMVGEGARNAPLAEGGETTVVAGVARAYDVRNKVLYIDEIDPPTRLGATTDTAGSAYGGPGLAEHAIVSASAVHKLADEKNSKGRRTEEDQYDRRCARHVLDVTLSASLSPQGEELFKQLQAFVCAFKTDLARASLDLAVDAAADLGASCRLVLDFLVVDLLNGEVATETFEEEKLILAAKGVAVSAVAAVLRGAQRVVIARYESGSGRPRRRSFDPAATASAGSVTENGKEKLRRPGSSISLATPDQGSRGSSYGDTITKRKDSAAAVDESIAERMRFSCTTIVRERRHGAPRDEVEDAAPGKGRRTATGTSSDVTRRDGRRHDLQYLAKWTVEDGISTVVVSGRSYLDAVASEKKTGGGGKPINLEGGDTGMQRVLDHHGVTLSACVQAFDLMQDMEDPTVVLGMLATGICQLSTRYPEEGVDFSSLNESDQDALKDDVLSQLHHAMSQTAGAAPEWDELAVRMKAYGGPISVRLVRNSGNNSEPQGGGEKDLVVHAPSATGWLSAAEAAATMASPSSPPEASPPSSRVEPLPPSAAELAVALMRCNLCEVLGTLSPGIGTDGRIALIGRMKNSVFQSSRASSTLGGGGGERSELSDEGAFRCSLEVAWDKEQGGVFVKRFGMEPDHRRARFNLRAIGIQGFSITQLPVTLEDIDEVWDQAGIDETSESDNSTTGGRLHGSASSTSTSRSTEGGGCPSPPSESGPASSARSSHAQVSAGMEESSARASNKQVSRRGLRLSNAGRLMEGATAEEAEASKRASVAWGAHADPGEHVGAASSHESGKAAQSMVVEAAVAEEVSGGISTSDDPSSPDDGKGSGNRAGSIDGQSGVLTRGEGRGVSVITVDDTTKAEPCTTLIYDDANVISSEEEQRDVAVDPGVLVAGPDVHDVDHGERTSLVEIASKKERVLESTPNDSSEVQPAVERTEKQEAEMIKKEEETGNLGEREDDEREEEKGEGHGGVEGKVLQDKNQEGGGKTTGNLADEQDVGDGAQMHQPRVQTKRKNTTDGIAINMLEETTVSLIPEEAGTSQRSRRAEEEASASCAGSLSLEETPPASSDLSDRADLTVTNGLSIEKRAKEPLDPSEAVRSNKLAVQSLASCDEGGDGGDGEPLQQDGLRMSATIANGAETAGDTPTASSSSGMRAVEGGKSEQDGVDTREFGNDETTAEPGHQLHLDELKDSTNQEECQHLLVQDITGGSQSQGVPGGSPVGLESKVVERGDIIGDSSTSQSVSGEDGVHEENVHDASTHSPPPGVWAFPPLFEALLTLSTATGTVECTLEGEVVLGSADDKNMGEESSEATASTAGIAGTRGLSWQSRCCVYKIPIEEAAQTLPAGDIDLEDDDAQARLEDLLARAYGLTMEDVLERFSPETDLGSGDAVVKSFTDSICKLRPGLLARSQRPQPDGREDSNGGSTDCTGDVYEAVEAALRGDNIVPGGQEVHVRVGDAHVLEVSIVSASAGNTGEGDDEREPDGGENASGDGEPEADSVPCAKPAVPLSDAAHTCVVDCSGVPSPRMLRTHLEERGVYPPAMDSLDRSGFFAGGPRVMNLAGVLAALAQEVRETNTFQNKPTTRVGPLSSPPAGRACGHEGWPEIDPERSRSQVLRPFGRVQRGGPRAAQECTVAVSGTREDIILDVYPAMTNVDHSGHVPEGVSARMSRFRPLSASTRTSPSSSPEIARICKSADAEKTEERRNSDKPDSPGDSHHEKRILDVSTTDDVPPGGLNIGDRVEARFGGKSEWFPGVVTGIHCGIDEDRRVGGGGGSGGGSDGGSCGGSGGGSESGRHWPKSTLPYITVDYDDGDVEERVPRVRVRQPGQKQPRFLNKGDEVDVKRGKRIFLARVVARAASSPPDTKEGCYDLELLDDGRPGRNGDGSLVANCPRSAMMALHSWPPPRMCRVAEGGKKK